MALPGVGKGIAGYIEEFLGVGEFAGSESKGVIRKLEEMRAGL